MSRNISILDLAPDARAQALEAIRHRPDTAEGLRTAARSLTRQGLKPRDVAAVLGLTAPAVEDLLLPTGAELDALIARIVAAGGSVTAARGLRVRWWSGDPPADLALEVEAHARDLLRHLRGAA